MYILLVLAVPIWGKVKRSAKDLESQLYEDLLFDYNKIPRPVKNSSDVMTVDVGASLIRIIDVASFYLLQIYENLFRTRRTKFSRQICG